MTVDITCAAPLRRKISGLAIAAALASLSGTAAAGSLAEEFAKLGTDTIVSRSIALSDLGIGGPIALQSRQNHRDLYLPVPANVAISDATIHFDAGYVLPEAARTKLSLSLDNNTVAARALTQDRGETGIDIGVDNTPRPTGFVQFGVQWDSIAANARCADVNAPSNALRIRPGTSLSYRFDSKAVRDLATAWTALPPSPVVLTSGKKLSSQSYETTWRLGVALSRFGRHPIVRFLPEVGDDIDLKGVSIPEGLRSIPAFEALSRGGHYKVGDPAEVGALIMLGAAGPLHADLAIVDQAMGERGMAAINALREQIRKLAPEALDAFTQWQDRVAGAMLGKIAKDDIRLAQNGGVAMIAVGAEAGAKAADLLDSARRRTVLQAAAKDNAPSGENGASAAIPIGRLGSFPASVDIGGYGEWQASFDLSDISYGRTPTQAVLDVAAVPVANFNAITAAVFMNDVLLGSQRMTANGKVERIAVKIPRYALGPTNVLRVAFQRPALADDCNAASRAAPVSVLPTSHLVFEKKEPADDFTGMLIRYSAGATVAVPRNYLDDASSLDRVIRVARGAGVSPLRAQFLVSEGGAFKPQGPFLAFDAPLDAAREKIRFEGGRLVLASYGERKQLDAATASRMGAVEINRVGDQTGILYRSPQNAAPEFDKPFALSRGDVALLGREGIVAELDSDGSSEARLMADGAQAWWRRALWWMAPTIFVTFFIGLLIGASYVRRRADRELAQREGA